MQAAKSRLWEIQQDKPPASSTNKFPAKGKKRGSILD